MASLLSPLSSAWHSYAKQPLLWWVTLLLLFPSLLIGDIITTFFLEPAFLPLTLVVLFASLGLHVWGQACVLLGRESRRSLHALLRDAQSLILPLLLTSILRQCLIFLWGLLLIIPGVLYAIRTALFDAVLVLEGQQYRPALQRSTCIVRMHTLRTTTIIVAVYLIFFLPVYLLDFLASFLPRNIGILILKNLLLAVSSALSFLTHIALYNELLTTGLAEGQSPAPPAEFDEIPEDDE